MDWVSSSVYDNKAKFDTKQAQNLMVSCLTTATSLDQTQQFSDELVLVEVIKHWVWELVYNKPGLCFIWFPT